MSTDTTSESKPSTPPHITLVFSGLPPSLTEALETELNTPKKGGHPFVGRTHVEVLRHPEGLLFRLDEGQGGYTFCRNLWGSESDAEVFRRFLQDPVQTQYMPITYEVKERKEEIVQDILARYANFGSQHAAKIDWIWYERKGRHLLILRIPKEIVRAMIHRQGGVLSTQVRGPVSALRALPVLSKIVPEDAKDDEVMHRAFITPYTAAAGSGGAEYDQCMAVHQAALREVIAAGAVGITIGPIGTWTP